MTENVDPNILRRFELCQKIGRGAYGIVWKAFDKKMTKVIALNKFFEAFRNSTDAQRTFREVMYLQALLGHENIVRLQNLISAENDCDLYFTFYYSETGLHAVIRANILQGVYKQYIIYQFLKALKFIPSEGILHRYVKPRNLLINSDCHIKICDFGLCRSLVEIEGQTRNHVLTGYIVTRWYWSPEVLLGLTNYTKGVDIWAVGCILGEMIRHRPLLPGT